MKSVLKNGKEGGRVVMFVRVVGRLGLGSARSEDLVRGGEGDNSGVNTCNVISKEATPFYARG